MMTKEEINEFLGKEIPEILAEMERGAMEEKDVKVTSFNSLEEGLEALEEDPMGTQTQELEKKSPFKV